MLNNINTADVDFEFDMVAAKKFQDAKNAGIKAALKSSGKGNSASAAFDAAFDAAFFN